jgi:uncharacterized membrane protein
MFYSPLSFLFMVLFFAIIIFFFTVMQINIIAVAFERIGIPPHYVMSALMASFLGSLINIPIKRIPQEVMTDKRTMTFFAFRYVIPKTKRDYTIVAVNVGGAIIPFCISVYLLLKTGLYLHSMVATGCTAVAAYRMAKPIPGVGIALPFFLTPVLAAVISVIIAYSNAPVVAYIAGSLGTLIGADIFNLNKISHLGAPIASIGGAGTFDGVFLSGILAVILSTILV